METKQLIALPFYSVVEHARQHFSLEPLSRQYTFELKLDNSSRAEFKLKSILNYEYGAEPYELGAIVFVRFGDQTEASRDPVPFPTEKMEKEIERVSKRHLLNSMRGLAPEPSEVEAVQQKEEAIVEKYHQRRAACVEELSQVWKSLRESLAEYEQAKSAQSEASGIPNDVNDKITEILAEIQQQRIEQGEMQSILDAIRRFLVTIQKTGLPTDDATQQRLAKINRAVDSDQSFQQKLEVSLPIIPFLLEYKMEVGASVDVGAAREELKERLRKSQSKR